MLYLPMPEHFWDDFYLPLTGEEDSEAGEVSVSSASVAGASWSWGGLGNGAGDWSWLGVCSDGARGWR